MVTNAVDDSRVHEGTRTASQAAKCAEMESRAGELDQQVELIEKTLAPLQVDRGRERRRIMRVGTHLRLDSSRVRPPALWHRWSRR